MSEQQERTESNNVFMESTIYVLLFRYVQELSDTVFEHEKKIDELQNENQLLNRESQELKQKILDLHEEMHNMRNIGYSRPASGVYPSLLQLPNSQNQLNQINTSSSIERGGSLPLPQPPTEPQVGGTIAGVKRSLADLMKDYTDKHDQTKLSNQLINLTRVKHQQQQQQFEFQATRNIPERQFDRNQAEEFKFPKFDQNIASFAKAELYTKYESIFNSTSNANKVNNFNNSSNNNISNFLNKSVPMYENIQNVISALKRGGEGCPSLLFPLNLQTSSSQQNLQQQIQQSQQSQQQYSVDSGLEREVQEQLAILLQQRRQQIDNQFNYHENFKQQKQQYAQLSSDDLSTNTPQSSQSAENPHLNENQHGKKQRMNWTHALHMQFEDAVKALGGAWNTTPTQIHKYMNVPELTLGHIKSHLQKYRNKQQIAANVRLQILNNNQLI